MVLDWMREWLLSDINYIPTFHRVWESIRREIKLKDVKKIRTRNQDLMQLKKQRSKLLFELRKTPESKLVEADPETMEKYGKLERVKRLEGLLKREKYPRRSFTEFIGKKQSIATYVDYVDKNINYKFRRFRDYA